MFYNNIGFGLSLNHSQLNIERVRPGYSFQNFIIIEEPNVL